MFRLDGRTLFIFPGSKRKVCSGYGIGVGELLGDVVSNRVGARAGSGVVVGIAIVGVGVVNIVGTSWGDTSRVNVGYGVSFAVVLLM